MERRLTRQRPDGASLAGALIPDKRTSLSFWTLRDTCTLLIREALNSYRIVYSGFSGRKEFLVSY